MFELRPYQQEAKDNVFYHWDVLKNKNVLLNQATGTGKTVTFTSILKDCIQRGDRCLVLAHSGTLLDQARDKIKRLVGVECALEKSESSARDAWERVVLGSIQSLSQDKRLSEYPKNHFDTIVVDEAHHVMAPTYRSVLDHFSSAKVLGVTATPDRGDMQDLGEVFCAIAHEYTLPQAVRDGYLCPIKALSIPLNIDISNVKCTSDYQLGSIGNVLDPYLHQIAREIVDKCSDRKTIIFLPLIKTSLKMKEILISYGLHAEEVNGKSADREQILQDFADNKFQVLCNAMLLTEGYDCPDIDCVVPLRPTKIRSLFAQMVGRGTRIHPGKKNLLLLDFLWSTAQHNLCRPAHLIASSNDIADKATKLISQKEDSVDLEEIIDLAEEEVLHEREEALAKRLAEMRRKKMRLVDPLQYEMSIHGLDLSNYKPVFNWEKEKPDNEILSRIETLGVSTVDITNSGQATQILNTLVKRQRDGLSTPKQIRFLEQKKFKDVGLWSFDDANDMITLIKNNNWMVPYRIKASEYKPKGMRDEQQRNKA